MRNTSTLRKFAAWLAMLGMALNALWPLVAQAKPAAADPFAQVCTASGLKSAGPAGAPLPADGIHQPHCAFCTLAADKLAIPCASIDALPVAAATVASLPLLPDGLPRRFSSYSTPAPRGPPILS